MLQGQLPEYNVWSFLFAGKALFTVRSPHSGVHRTFKVLKFHMEGYSFPIWTVMVMQGPNNESDYRNIGYIKGNPKTKKVRFIRNKLYHERHPLIQAFQWVLRRANRADFGTVHGDAHVYHEGRCGRCGRLLTAPDSITRGFGPHCATKSLH